VDAVSGVSGAGRSPNDRTHFPHVSCQPYNVLAHRHAPEIAEHAGAPVHFVPHLGEWDRGILATVHLELASATDAAGLAAVYRGAYADEPFVRLLPPGAWPAVADVRHTNFADLAFTLDDAGTHAVVVAAIDNLVKGAAGQAVQCMNIRFGIDEGVLGPIPGPPTGAVATP
jgi:N-acetyl-gamma-glutamyl-phosphate reductase